jgi:chitodextrinase
MAVSTNQINLAWTASTNNIGVANYRIFRGSVQVATTTATAYGDTGLAPSTLYSYAVSACDVAGNCSGTSTSKSSTTLPPPSFTKAKGFDSDVYTIAPAVDGSGDLYVGGEFATYGTTIVDRIAKLINNGTVR